MRGAVQIVNAFLAICLPLSASYPIRMGRPDRVGGVVLVQAEGKQSMTGMGMVSGQPTPFPERITAVSLHYKREVLAINENRMATKLKLTLGKSKCTVNGVALALPRAGSVIEVKRENDKRVFLKDRFPLPEPIQEALGIVVELGDGRDEEDLQFGTNSPKEVGDSWDVNAENILVILGREIGLVGDPEKIVGKTKLEAVEKNNDVDCMRVATHFEIRDVKSAFFVDKEMGLKLTSANMKVDQKALLPIETDLQPHSLQVNFVLEAKGTGEIEENGVKAPFSMEIKMEEWTDLKMTVVPPKNNQPAK